MSFVLYFRLSDGYSKELPHSFIESIRVRASLVFNLFFSVISVTMFCSLYIIKVYTLSQWEFVSFLNFGSSEGLGTKND
jgi:hypothetical protein